MFLCCRRGVGMSQGGEVAEAAPVSDLLGSIMSSQNVLMMDSSDVVINRDGTLKAIKPGQSFSRPFSCDMWYCHQSQSFYVVYDTTEVKRLHVFFLSSSGYEL